MGESVQRETGEKDYHTNGYDITFDHMRFSYEPGKHHGRYRLSEPG